MLALGELVRITGLPLRAGTFDGSMCTYEAKDGTGALSVGLQDLPRTSGYIDHLKGLDVGTGVTVPGAEDAAAVTVTSGSGGSRATRIALVAKVGHLRLSVVLTSKHPSLDTAVRVAELVIGE